VRDQASVGTARVTIDHQHASCTTTLDSDLARAASPIAVAGQRMQLPVPAASLARAAAARRRGLGTTRPIWKKGCGRGGERHRCLMPAWWRSATKGDRGVGWAACKSRFGGGQEPALALKGCGAGVREPLKGSRKNLAHAVGRRQSWRESAARRSWEKR